MKKIYLFMLAAMTSLASMAQVEQVTFTCTGGTAFGEGEGCAKAFDGNLNTKWGMYGSGDRFAVVEASEKVYLTGYTLVNANDNNKFNRDIKEWEIFGTNDETTATTHTTNTDGWTRFCDVREHSIGKKDFSVHYFTINNAQQAYKYFLFKRVCGTGEQSQLSEISFSYTTVPSFNEGIAYTVLEGSDGWSSNEGPQKMFDGIWNTKYCCNQCWTLEFNTNEAITVTGINMTTANDAKERDPKKWKLYGATDTGQIWNLLHEEKGENQLPEDRYAAKDYTIDGVTNAYKRFKLVITETRGNGNLTQISELSLKNTEGKEVTYSVSVDCNPASGNETAENLFDVDTGTKWCTKKAAKWYTVFQTGTQVTPNGYYFVTGNDHDERDPKAWKLYASNSLDSEWTLLDSRSDIDMSTDRREYVAYEFDNTNKYQYYKLEVTDRRGGGDGHVQFGEFGLRTMAKSTLVDNSHIIVYEGAGGKDHENVTKLFDGVTGTKWCADKTSAIFGVGCPVSLSGYGIQVADEWRYYDRIPKSWTLEGSNDYSNWTVIDTKTDDATLQQTPMHIAYFMLDKPSEEYKYFKFTITDTRGAQNFQIAEFIPLFEKGEMSKLEIKDATEPIIYGQTKVNEIDFIRTLSAGKWNTFCVPFDMDIPDGWTVKELTAVNVNGDNYSMTFSNADSIKAGKPYMIKVDTEKTSVTISDKYISGLLQPVTLKGLTFQGTYVNGNALTGSFIISNNNFYLVNSEVNLKAFRGYITVENAVNNAPTLTFSFDDDETAITEMEDGTLKVEGRIFNLAGQRLPQMQKGVNIVNGKKVLK